MAVVFGFAQNPHIEIKPTQFPVKKPTGLIKGDVRGGAVIHLSNTIRRVDKMMKVSISSWSKKFGILLLCQNPADKDFGDFRTLLQGLLIYLGNQVSGGFE
jgi:hypothetical protein